jgi:hypothetical protein
MLYAAGALAEAEVAAFERRLGEDQAAREAVCRAVLVRAALAGQPAPVPDPAYRTEVRGRLGPRVRVAGRPRYPAHPLFWTCLGAAAALLLAFAVRGPARPNAPASGGETIRLEPAPPAVEPGRGWSPDTANLWSELSSTDHLAKARAEELRRKSRAETRFPFLDEHHHRLLGDLPLKR